MAPWKRRLRKRELTVAKRAKAVDRVQNGESYRSVAQSLGVGKHFVEDAVRRYRDHHRYSDLPRSGRPTVVTPTNARRITKFARNTRFGTVRKVQEKLRVSGVRLSVGTVHKVIRKAGLVSYKPMKRPLLTTAHKVARLAWAKAQ